MAEPLRAALATRGVSLEACAEIAEARAIITANSPSLLLLSLPPSTNPEDIGELAGRLLADQPTSARLVILIPREDIRLRLAALRAGAEACLTFPSVVDELAERLARLVGARRPDPERILVVDDQPVAALFASRVLQGAGMVTERVSDPLRVIEALERFNPDLVLMDLHMPGASGIELTGIIRGHDQFAELPIIFLSAELDPDLQLEALRIGGDDFLSKPVAPDRLVSSVRERLRRATERRRHIHGPETLDPLTRLGTRERLLKHLDWLIGQSYSGRSASEASGFERRAGQRAIIYLELMGDEESLEVMAAEIAARLHQGDLAARVGERSVAILVWRANHQAITQFAQILTFQVVKVLDQTTMGAALGSGWYPLTGACQDSVTLLSRARKAADASLRRGGERVARYQPVDAREEDELHVSQILEAVEDDRLQRLFEPMVALTGLIGERYEMTPRLCIGGGELLSPAAFLPVVARSDLAPRLDRWLLSSGLDALKERMDNGKPVLLFIHQTLLGLEDDGWIDWVRDQINDRDLIRLRPVLQFEITEADQQLKLATRRARELGRLGIRICLNGIDFSERSMRVLHALPSAYARISRSVIHGPDADSIAWLIQSVQACGARVIATGVDGPTAIAQLFSAGVDLIQGPYVQPPTIAMDFEFSV
ncbi:EAL domain-containing protein [Thiocystis violacea]|uniref:EAL domain-containing response regulator n=1 Tax=Thiocystis violacea TaxID=13725 RepID=UPI001F5B538C|nr:EAL domain-containing protein [Thiocystis violacea]